MKTASLNAVALNEFVNLKSKKRMLALRGEL